MIETRVQLKSIVENQLPEYVKLESPLFGDFLKTYYASQEYSGGPLDISQNIDQYVKVGTYSSIVSVTYLVGNVDFDDTTITVDSTNGWPKEYGLLKIDDEIISYTGKTDTQFTGCIRGFSGITSYRDSTNPDELVFERTEEDQHINRTPVFNLTSEYLKLFFKKLKTQFAPGFEDRELADGLNQTLFVKQAKDFYTSKGTDKSFEILFRALFGVDVEVIKPQDSVFKLSDAKYRRYLEMVLEVIVAENDADVDDLVGQTLFQDPSNFNGDVRRAYGSITKVEKLRRENQDYVKVGIDYDFSRDVEIFGTLYGEFKITGKTKLIDNVAVGGTYINVDSTVGFATAGELYVSYNNGTVGVVTYSKKTVNQFLSVNGIEDEISIGETVLENNRVYSTTPNGDQIDFSITGVLNTLNYNQDKVVNYEKDDRIYVSTLGEDYNDPVSNSFIYNTHNRFKIKSINNIDLGKFEFRSYESHQLNLNDRVEVINIELNQVSSGRVVDISSEFDFVVEGLSDLTSIGRLRYTYEVRRKPKYADAINFETANKFYTDVINTYKDDDNNVYVVSNSIPSYDVRLELGDRGVKIPPNIYSGDTLNIPNHGFITGEEVNYVPDKETIDSSELFDATEISLYGEDIEDEVVTALGSLSEKQYYVKVVDTDNIKLSNSRADIASGVFLNISGIATNQYLYPSRNYLKPLDAQKIIRAIPSATDNEALEFTTSPDARNGILVNGVEIQNYKSENYIYYGEIERIDVISGGRDYDVINPPSLIISDSVGTGATATLTVRGSFNSIQVVDGGFSYVNPPTVIIEGGNGEGAKAEAILKQKVHEQTIIVNKGAGTISTTANTVAFSTYHGFLNGELIYIDNNDQRAIGVGSTAGDVVRIYDIDENSGYFVNTPDLYTITLHTNTDDAKVGINTVNITDFGQGKQTFRADLPRNVIARIDIVDPGEGYTNNTIKVQPSGINTSSDVVSFQQHGFADGDLIEYRFDGTGISGLTTDQQYYVLRLNDDSFRVSAAGIGTTLTDAKYLLRDYEDLKSTGIGTHTFKYPDITVTIDGDVGISTLTFIDENPDTVTGIGSTNAELLFPARIQPIVLGEIIKANIVSGGIGYGNSEVVNYEKQPLLTLNTGINAQLKPIIVQEKISDVIVINEGSGYNSPPVLGVQGDGDYADIIPVVEGGRIVDVIVQNGGVGFSTAKTFIQIEGRGIEAKFKTRIGAWNINNVARYEDRFGPDDSLLSPPTRIEYGSEYTHLYAPRALRRKLYSRNINGTKNYGSNDLNFSFTEEEGIRHSPIIGWAYDGNPIYGPYGYDRPEGGRIRRMQSGYRLVSSSSRPSEATFPLGYFVNDYIFTNSGDLDVHNGRFCKTPDFPKGRYCYFATIGGRISNDGTFKGYYPPAFPYLIGDSFRSRPVSFNLLRTSNTDDIDLNESGFIRNATPYKINSIYGQNEYIINPTDDERQYVNVERATTGKVENFTIVSAGSSYRVGDRLEVDNENNLGDDAQAVVSWLGGRNITSIAASTYTLPEVQLYLKGGTAIAAGICTIPHGLRNNDSVVISGLSTDVVPQLAGRKTVGITTTSWRLVSAASTPSTTGLTTYLSIAGDLSPTSIKENDVIGIAYTTSVGINSFEKFKVLNVETQHSRIRVQRESQGTIGIAHSYFAKVISFPREFTFDVTGVTSSLTTKLNSEIYFNPIDQVGIGTTIGIGIVSSIPSNIGIGTTTTYGEVKVGGIYLEKHGFRTGQKLTYHTNGGTGLTVSNNVAIGTELFTLNDGSTVYAIELDQNAIGLSTTRVAIGTNTDYVGVGSTAYQLRFHSVGTGVTHSFRTVYDAIGDYVVTGDVSISDFRVYTEIFHHLGIDDNVQLDVLPGITTSVFVQFNEYNNRIVFNRVGLATANIDTANNLITITNHKLRTGDKIIWSKEASSTVPSVIDDNGMYYVVKDNDNRFRITRTKLEAESERPVFIDFTDAGSGNQLISLVNPPINEILGNRVSFATTDPSLAFSQGNRIYPAYALKFYTDPNYENEFYTTGNDDNFAIVTTGQVGDPSTASSTTLYTNRNFPEKLYYRFEPDYINRIPTDKDRKDRKISTLSFVEDDDVTNYNTLLFDSSGYNGNYSVVGIASTSFKLNSFRDLEKNGYERSEAIFSYITNSKYVQGPIKDIKLKSGGFSYNRLPGITSIGSSEGTGAIIKPNSNSIGKIKGQKLRDVGWGYPSDLTLKPKGNIPELLSVDSLFTIGNLGIVTGGRNYIIPPTEFVVFDGASNEYIPEIQLKFELTGTSIGKVRILSNSSRLSNANPIILPLNNSNGVGIRTVEYNSAEKIVTLKFDVGFSTSGTFPFKIGDKVLVENVGIASTGSGYNSSDYNYKLFEVIEVDQNIGGIGSIAYKLDDTVTYPGLYVTTRSYGRVIPPQDLPQFNATLIPTQFKVGETIVSNTGKTGKVDYWDSVSKIIKVESNFNFSAEETVRGLSSKAQAVVRTKVDHDSEFTVDAVSAPRAEWVDQRGFLSENTQRLHDSFYYQNFSYVLKSEISYEKWEEAVNSLNHALGFKKFSDMQIISQPEDDDAIANTPTESLVDVTLNLDGEVKTYCKFDFDIGVEKTLRFGTKNLSNEVIFNNRIITDYVESIGNRVLAIDNISTQFSNVPRQTPFSVVDDFLITDTRTARFFCFIRDVRYTDEVQAMVFDFLHDGVRGYLAQYALTSSLLDLGGFDFELSASTGQVQFFPTKFAENNYEIFGFSIQAQDYVPAAIPLTISGITTIGDNVEFVSSTRRIGAGTTDADIIVGIATTTYNSVKVIVQAIETSGESQYETNQMSLMYDGTDVYELEYGRINNLNAQKYTIDVGLGTFSSNVSGGNINLVYHPDPSKELSLNIFETRIRSGVSTVGYGTESINQVEFGAGQVSWSAGIGSTTIHTFPENYKGAYYILRIENTTTGAVQFEEAMAITDSGEEYLTEFAKIVSIGQTNSALESGIGTVFLYRNSEEDNRIELKFTPHYDGEDYKIDVVQHAIVSQTGEGTPEIDYTAIKIKSLDGTYTGTLSDVRRSFGLFNGGRPIFIRNFNAASPDVVDVSNDKIIIPDHFYVTGEKLTYDPAGVGNTASIGIGTTTIPGIGATSLLPSTVYVVKVDDRSIRVAASATEALQTSPNYLSITSVGIGTSHSFTTTNQNSRVLLTLDNNVQAPIVATGVTNVLIEPMNLTQSQMKLSGITSIFGADLIRIDDEIVRVNSVGVGSTNIFLVTRAWMGTSNQVHAPNSTVEKLIGDFNIVGNTLNFVEAPIGSTPQEDPTDPNQTDYSGIQTSSTFTGRSFIRSGVTGSAKHTYEDNYIFDSLTRQFDGVTKTFTLTSETQNVTGIATNNSAIVVNQIFQKPGILNDYTLEESSGITSITFSGFAASVAYDPNVSSIPVGGVIAAVGSTRGFGYQPLISAGATAIVSGFGTISSIAIGNSGSGYRSGIQTFYNQDYVEVTVNVGIRSTDLDTAEVLSIGTATVSNGNLTEITFNPTYSAGTAYTFTNPPIVIIDAPQRYSNVPLIYSAESTGRNIGTNATATIVVGQGSSVIEFEITNNGYGYDVSEILTIDTASIAGIPTNTTAGNDFIEFQITIDNIESDSFTGWHFGQLEILDNIEDQFDGTTQVFNLAKDDIPFSIIAKRGSLIDVRQTLIIFINDILQEPNAAYIFNGGSQVAFTEPPKEGDTCRILFYKGTGAVDVVDRDIEETIKVGDTIQLLNRPTIDLVRIFDQEERIITGIQTVDTINTSPYSGVGISTDNRFERPITWCKQQADLFINGQYITKDRPLYRSRIQPAAHILKSVGVADTTIIYVDTVATIFDGYYENLAGTKQDVYLVDQDTRVAAAGTAIISGFGTVLSIDITDPGFGYINAPSVSIAAAAGLGTTTRAQATATVSAAGTVSAITMTAPGTGYTFTQLPPILIEADRLRREKITSVEYSGDFGIVSGIGSTSVGVATTGITFDLLIPNDSVLRKSDVTGPLGITTISGITTGQYIVITETSIGAGYTSYDREGGRVGVGTSCLDNVYQVIDYTDVYDYAVGFGTLVGVGSTYFRRITVSVNTYDGMSGFGNSNFYGKFSWGVINNYSRTSPLAFTAYLDNGVSGLTTGPIIQRVEPLKSSNYL